MATSLSREVPFRALHRFFRPDWSEARNREAFGPLSEPPGHAHDYRCVVTVAGPIAKQVLDAVLATPDRLAPAAPEPAIAPAPDTTLRPGG